MDKVYRFYAYNNFWWPDKYLWWQSDCDAYLMMSAANFIDTLLEALGPSIFGPRAETRPIIKSETIHVDLDRLLKTNSTLAYKTIRMIQDFDDISLSPDTIEKWLAEIEAWVCGKVINNENN